MGVGGGQKFLLNRLQAVGMHDADNTASSPMVTQPTADLQAAVRILVCSFSPPAAASKWPGWGSNRRPQGCRWAALLLGHCLDSGQGLPCCLGPHLPLTQNPNCVYLSDCLLAGSGIDWLTGNLSSRCTAEGNRIFFLWAVLEMLEFLCYHCVVQFPSPSGGEPLDVGFHSEGVLK